MQYETTAATDETAANTDRRWPMAYENLFSSKIEGETAGEIEVLACVCFSID